MSIRILDQNGIVQPLSASIMADFQIQLRRIGEAPSSQATNTVNLWICDQSPEELLNILRRLPDRSNAAAENDGGAAQMSQSRISDLRDGDRVSSSSTAADTTSHHNSHATQPQTTAEATTAASQTSQSPPATPSPSQHDEPSTSNPPPPPPARRKSLFPLAMEQLSRRRLHNTAYQRQTVQSLAEGAPELFRLNDGGLINLWDEYELYRAEKEELEKEREEKEKGKEKTKEEEEEKGN